MSKIWIKKGSTLRVDGKDVGFNESFDEKKVNKNTLKKLIADGSVGDEIVATKKITADATKELKDQHKKIVVELNADHVKEIEALVADCEAKISEGQAKLEKAEADHAEEVKTLKAEIASLKKGSK